MDFNYTLASDMIQELVDLNLEYFQFYADCGLEQFLIQLATKVSRITGLISSAINLYFVLQRLFLSTDWQL